MSTQEYLSGIGFILSVMAVSALVEAALPLYAARGLPPGRRRANLLMTAQTLTFNLALAAVVAAAAPWLQDGSPGVLASLGLPLAAQTVVALVALDFAFGYFAHRAMHEVPVFWRFHRVHHSDAFVDVTTTYRTHPVESAWRYACVLVPVWALGVSPAVFAFYRVASALNGILEHANVRVQPGLDTLVSQVWVTPNMHKVHHSRDQMETDTNYGNLLSLYDRMLRTFTPSERAFHIRYGLEDADHAEGEPFGRLMAMPFRVGTSAIERQEGSLVGR